MIGKTVEDIGEGNGQAPQRPAVAAAGGRKR